MLALLQGKRSQMVQTRRKKAAAAQDGAVNENKAEPPAPQTQTPTKRGRRGRPPKNRTEGTTPSTSGPTDVSNLEERDETANSTLLTCQDDSMLKTNEAESLLEKEEDDLPAPSHKRMKKEVVSPEKPKNSAVPPPPPLSRRRSAMKLKVKQEIVEKDPEPEPIGQRVDEEQQLVPAPLSPPHPEDPQPSSSSDSVKEPETLKEVAAVRVKEEPETGYFEQQVPSKLIAESHIKQEPEPASESSDEAGPVKDVVPRIDCSKQGEDTVNDMDIADSDSESGGEAEVEQPSSSAAPVPVQEDSSLTKEIHIEVDPSFSSKPAGLTSWERKEEKQSEPTVTSPVRRPRIHFLHPAYQSFASEPVHISPQPPPPPPPEPAPIKETENGFSMGFKPMAFKSKVLKTNPLIKPLEVVPSDAIAPPTPVEEPECSTATVNPLKRNSNFGSSASNVPPPKMVDLPKLSFFNMPPTTSATSQENEPSSEEPPQPVEKPPPPKPACAMIQPAAPRYTDADLNALKAKAERVAQDIARRHHAADKQKEERDEHDRRREERERRHKRADEERMEHSKQRQREDDERRARDRELRHREREEKESRLQAQRDLERKQREEESKVREQERKAREDERKTREEEKKIKEEDMKVPPFELLAECRYFMKNANKKKTDSLICYCAENNMNCSDRNCVNRAMQTECPASCPAKCKNQRFAKRKYAQVEAYHTGTAKGCGLRALKDIKQGRFIIEYVGEVVERDDYEKRKQKYALDKKHKHHYLCDTGVYTIDATTCGNPSRFVNHSCDPNAICEKWAVPRTPGDISRIGFFAKRDINAGEEITFNYQFVNYGRDAQACFCGASNCTGWIGEKPDLSSDDEDEDDEDVSETRFVNIDDNYDERLEEELYDLEPDEQIKYLDEEFASFVVQKKKHTKKILTLATRMTDYQQRENFIRSIFCSEIGTETRQHFGKEGICSLIAEWLSDDDFSVSNLKLVSIVLQSLNIDSFMWKSNRYVMEAVDRWANITYDDWFDIHVVTDSLIDCISEPGKKYSEVCETTYNETRTLVQSCKSMADRLQKLNKTISFKIPRKARDQEPKDDSKAQSSNSSNSHDSHRNGALSPPYQRHHHHSSSYCERETHPRFFNNGNDVHQYRFGGYHGNNYKENYATRRISYRDSVRERRRNGRRSRSRSRSVSPQLYKRRKLEERERNRSPAYDRRAHSPRPRSPGSIESGEKTVVKSESKMHAASDSSSGAAHMAQTDGRVPIPVHPIGYPHPHDPNAHPVPHVGYPVPGYEYGMFDPGMFMYHPTSGYFPAPYHPAHHPAAFTMETLPPIEKLNELYEMATVDQLTDRLEKTRKEVEILQAHIVRKRAEEEAAAAAAEARRQVEEEARRQAALNANKFVWAKAKCDTGEIYYYNKLTKETQWSPPSAEQGLLEPSDRASPDTTVAAAEDVKPVVAKEMPEEVKIKVEVDEPQTVVDEESARKSSRDRDRERERDRDRDHEHRDRDRDRDRDRREGSRHKDHSHRRDSFSREERRGREFKVDLEKAVRSVVKSAIRSLRDATHDKTNWLIKMVTKEMYKRESQQSGFDFRFTEATERKVRNYTKSLIERKLKADDLWKGYSEGR